MVKCTNPGNRGRGKIDDPFINPVLGHVLRGEGAGELSSSMSRDFGPETIEHIERELLPRFIEAGDAEKAELCEKVLAKYGRALPNHVSGLWEPLEVPRNELQVRELLAAQLPDYGYRLVASQAEFPDWLLIDDVGNFIYAEVEHRSCAFRDHGHDAGMCDLIICWEHNWPESPLPVLEMLTGQTTGERKVRPKPRGGLSIHFSAALSRAARQGGRIGNGVPRNVKSENRRFVAASHYERLIDGGVNDTNAVRSTARLLGTTSGNVRQLLANAGARQPRKTKRAMVVARVEELMLSGLSSPEANERTASEFGIKRQTVESYRSRTKKRS